MQINLILILPGSRTQSGLKGALIRGGNNSSQESNLFKTKFILIEAVRIKTLSVKQLLQVFFIRSDAFIRF